jgi:ppGpp synthetase/RelA/SpoT-type nucleotidyltranferase
MFDTSPPWGKNDVKRLGRLVQSGSLGDDSTSIYSDFFLWNAKLSSEVKARLDSFDWTEYLIQGPPTVTARAKSIDTIREKLTRMPTYQLPTLHDIVGARLEADMTLSNQETIANEISRLFPGTAMIKGLRQSPNNGYRAVHVLLTMPAGRVEIQVRTRLQGIWANRFERMADVLGRQIRYGEPPDDEALNPMVQGLKKLSTVKVAWIEEMVNRGPSDTALAHPSGHFPFSAQGSDKETERMNALKKPLAVIEQEVINLLEDFDTLLDIIQEERRGP